MEQGIGHYVYPGYTRVIDTNESKNDINGSYSLVSTNVVRNDMLLEDTRACVKEGRMPVIRTKYNELVWHGGINLLGKEDAWDNLMRIRSVQVAAELLEIALEV